MVRLILALVLFLATFTGTVQPTHADDVTVRVTYYYPTGNPTYSGVYPYAGSAACSWNFPIGTQLQFEDGYIVICLDRGMLGWNGWVDIFASDWKTGQYFRYHYKKYEYVTILRWGWGRSYSQRSMGPR